MLPKENRLTKKEDFSQVYLRGIYFCQGNIAIKFLKNDTSSLRVGFSIGKTYSKLATNRNRARRVLRGVIGKHLPSIKNGYDMIVMIRGSEKTHSKNESPLLEADKYLKHIFSKTNLYK